MAEAPQPAPHDPVPATPQGAGRSASPGAGDAPPPAPLSGREAEQVYSPLSLLALGSFALAAVYAAIVVVGGLTAFLGKSPFLLPPWTIILPLGAVLAAWIARSQIQAAEGTLSGLPLTRWAMTLGLVFGLTYGAYYAATYTAVTRQADAFARRWLEEVRKGQLEKAFLLTLPPPRPAEDALPRDTLEVMHNTPDNTGKGTYTRFRQEEFIRLLAIAGPEAAIESGGVHHWAYEQGGYQVQLIYRITTPLAEYRVLVTAQGMTSLSGDFKGRQWYVVRENTGLPTEESEITYTAKGSEARAMALGVYQLVDGWTRDLAERNLDSAFMYTADQEMRDAFRKEGARWVAKGLLLGGLPTEPTGRELLRARTAFTQGSLVHAPESLFWADRTRRPEILAAVRNIFAAGLPSRRSFQVEYRIFPVIREEGSQTELGLDVRLELPRGNGLQPFLVEGRLVVKVDGTPTSPRTGTLRIARLELIRGQTAPTGSGPPGR